MDQNLAVNLARRLIEINSTNPGTYEKDMHTYIKRWLSRLPQVTVTSLEVTPGRANLMACLPFESSGKKMLPALTFICHMDTVVVGDGWTVPPFEARVENQKIYGRGACDMKSGLACCMSAFARAAQLISQGHVARRPLKLICTVDEEDFMRGSEHCISSGWVTRDDWIIDAEPTGGQIQMAHKGRIWYEIEVSGVTAHASTPWKGADAIAAMAEIICHIRQSIGASPPHADLGSSTVTFGQIEGGYRPYVVPDSCRLWVDIRPVPPLDSTAASKIIDEAVSRVERLIPGTRASYTLTGDRPCLEKDESSPLLASMAQACSEVTQKTPEISYFPGYTDTAVIAGGLGNKNFLSYGPGHLECAHKPDEWVEISDIERCEQVFRTLIHIIF